MYILFILFFISLAGIVVMIGRKLAPLRNGEIVIGDDYAHPFVPDLQKVREVTYLHIKKYGHMTLVTTVRLYVRGTNFLKRTYEEIKLKVHNLSKAKTARGERKEISKFLKTIGDYKHKIRELKHKIKEEENL